MLFCFIEARCSSFLVSKNLLGSLFYDFEPSWGAFWASWVSLGLLLEPLGSLSGGSWGGLGAVLRQACRTRRPLINFGSILREKRVPKGRHFGRQNGVKIDPKSKCKFKNEIITSWSRLGSILSRFPVRLGVKNIDLSLVF